MPKYQLQGPSIDLSDEQIAVLEAEQVADFPALTMRNVLRRVVEAERLRDLYRAEYERVRAEHEKALDAAYGRLRGDAA